MEVLAEWQRQPVAVLFFSFTISEKFRVSGKLEVRKSTSLLTGTGFFLTLIFEFFTEMFATESPSKSDKH